MESIMIKQSKLRKMAKKADKKAAKKAAKKRKKGGSKVSRSNVPLI
jgi:hypothetical protein